ncbi:Pumilio 7 isoform 2 [Gossypium australe]|uniref:Pumilio 7 isoform 2 n=1 Tax=Gossypium australe TaxID=47621 RepID=A0A5B6X3Z6_9ROSI|nr:Pumilio 7 isoform 2 [Gossypium australe]
MCFITASHMSCSVDVIFFIITLLHNISHFYFQTAFQFIFVAAAKYCVDIATHQHGCCVLQRCISHSTGEYREKLVEEISTNGLLLAQDAYGRRGKQKIFLAYGDGIRPSVFSPYVILECGDNCMKSFNVDKAEFTARNYVVQFILELKIPSATSTLVSQFQGNYVHLSSQKFSSHVVEKCLVVLNDESRSRIIRELLSATHFERLLQDPHANYVVQTALRVSEGPLHNSLIEAIESRKAISRNSPYSKRIFSQKLLKK